MQNARTNNVIVGNFKSDEAVLNEAIDSAQSTRSANAKPVPVSSHAEGHLNETLTNKLNKKMSEISPDLVRSTKSFAADLGFALNSDIEGNTAKIQSVLELKREIAETKKLLREQVGELQIRSHRYVGVAKAAIHIAGQLESFVQDHPHLARMLKLPENS